jgi:hypothetical protein
MRGLSRLSAMSAKLKPVTRRTRDAMASPVPTHDGAPAPPAEAPPSAPRSSPHVSRASSSAPREADGCAKCSGMESGTAAAPARLRSRVLPQREGRAFCRRAGATRDVSAKAGRAGGAPRAQLGEGDPPDSWCVQGGGAAAAAAARGRGGAPGRHGGKVA